MNPQFQSTTKLNLIKISIVALVSLGGLFSISPSSIAMAIDEKSELGSTPPRQIEFSSQEIAGDSGVSSPLIENKIEVIARKTITRKMVVGEVFNLLKSLLGAKVAFFNEQKLEANNAIANGGDDFQTNSFLSSFGLCGFTLFKVHYKSLDYRGRSIQLSGLIVVPDRARSHALPMVSYQHGTIVGGDIVPSNLEGPYARKLGLVFGGTCFLGVASDYEGLGDFKGFHPYLNLQTEGQNTKDLILAAIPFLKEQGYQVGKQLFLWGHSQGGHATLALQKNWESDPIAMSSQLKLRATVAVAGPLDLSGASLGSLIHPSALTTTYSAYIIQSFNKIYKIAKDIRSLVAEPWAGQLKNIFNGNMDADKVMKLLPKVPKLLLREAFYEGIATNDPNIYPAFMESLKLNNAFNYIPHSPVRLYHGRADKDVLFENSARALEAFKSQVPGGKTLVKLIDLGPTVDHDQAYTRGLAFGLHWFLQLRAD